MHIGILSLPSNFHCRKWAAALANAGAEVTVFSLEQPAAPIPKVKQVQIPIPFQRKTYRYWDYYGSAKQLRSALHHHGITHLHPLHLTPFGSWGLWSGFRPLIAAAMGADVLEYSETPPLNRAWWNTDGHTSTFSALKHWLKQRYYRQRVQAVVRHADAITADNYTLIRALQESFSADESKLHLIRWGIEPQLFTPQPEVQKAIRHQLGLVEGKPLVLAPRGANSFYQADVILEAFAQVMPAFPSVQFRLLSAGYPISTTIQKNAQRLEVQYPQQFQFVTNTITRESAAQLWLMTDVCISAPVYDGYSAALAEGRYAGAVPIVNAIAANLELIQDGVNGFVAAPFTAAQLSAILHKTLSKLTYYKAAFAEPNRSWIEAHSLLAPNAEQFIALCERFTKSDS